jgi:hypothetical protein
MPKRTLRVSAIALLLIICAPTLSVLPDDPYALRPSLVGEPPAERTWLEPTIEKVATLSQSDEYMLYTPGSATLGPNGSVLVMDFGDYKLKRFAPDGTYLQSYGNGHGQGPGEMLQLRWGGVWQDSLVYLVDDMQRQVNLFDVEGHFIEVEAYPEGVSQYGRGADGKRYVRLPPVPERPLLEIHTPDGVRQVPRFSTDPPDAGAWDDGWLNVHGDRVLHVALYAPVILAYAADDTVGTAHPTPDFGGPFHGTPMRTGEGIYHVWSQVDGDALTTQLWTTEGLPSLVDPMPDSLFFDVYDATDVSYQYSARFPTPGHYATYAPESGLLVAVQDTTVDLYRLTNE